MGAVFSSAVFLRQPADNIPRSAFCRNGGWVVGRVSEKTREEKVEKVAKGEQGGGHGCVVQNDVSGPSPLL